MYWKSGKGTVAGKLSAMIMAVLCSVALLATMMPSTAFADSHDGVQTEASVGAVKLLKATGITINSQPQSVSVAVGMVAEFSVGATGKTTLTYQWQCKAPGATTWSDSTQSGAKTKKLSVTTTVNHHGYQYRCLIKDGSGNKAYSSTATLTVKPKITTQPKSVTVKAGAVASFSVAATGKATLKYQWQCKAPGATSWSDSTQSGAKTSKLSVTTNFNHNGYQYRCVVTDGNGQKAYSGAATITLELQIKTQPKSTSVTVGSTAVFTVEAVGKATLKYQWQCKAPGATTWSDSTQSGAKTAKLSVSTNVNHNGYQYRCRVTDGNGKNVFSSAAMLTIRPKITTQPSSKCVSIGSTATFSVAATGKATLKYQWQCMAPSATTWTNSTQSGAKTTKLSIKTNVNHQGYRYRCVVTDGNGKQTISNVVTLTLCNIPITQAYFPDDIFRKYAAGKFDTDKNGTFSASELLAVKRIEVPAMEITDVKGVEFFTKLEYLDCSSVIDDYNEYLILRRNYIETLNVRCNTELKYLDCGANLLTSLDVSRNTKLETLKCMGYIPGRYYNTWDESRNYEFTSLKVDMLPNLKYLDCEDHILSTLDVTKNTNLSYLNCANNNLSKLNIANNTGLTMLFCSGNKITSLDVTKHTNLLTLRCAWNKIKSLNVTKNKKLEILDCAGNELTSINVSNNMKLTELNCSWVENMPDISNHTKLTQLTCLGCNVTSLNLGKLTDLFELYCSNNSLKKLDVSKNTKLFILECYGNQLTSLDLSYNTELGWLDVGENSLTKLDLRNCTNLYYVYADNGVTILYPEGFNGY